MEKIFVYDASDNKVEVDLVKYFKHKYTEYFIYTVHEKDEKGYVKLYVVKIMKELGITVSQNITEEDDWNLLESIVKQMIKEIKKDKIKSFVDLNSEKLNNIRIKKARFFKLDPKLVEMLNTNQFEKANKEETEKIINEMKTNDLFDNQNQDFELLYLNIKKEKDTLDVVLSNMLMKLTEYRLKYGRIDISEKEIPKIEIKDLKEPISEDDYETKYVKIKKEKEALDVVLANMLMQLTEYRLKYENK
ncbi:MAG: hypothetical protein PHN42_03630 [Bacilli bacterium]|nr:hypothetical protein [Bacilli bacterium]